MELVERQPDGTEVTLIHGLKGEQVKALTELAANTKPRLPFDVNAPVGAANNSPEHSTHSQSGEKRSRSVLKMLITERIR